MSKTSASGQKPVEGAREAPRRRTVRNPEFPIDRRVAAALEAQADADDRLLALRNQPDLDAEDSRQLRDAKAAILADLPGFASLREDLDTVTAAKSVRVAAALEARLTARKGVMDKISPPIPMPPPLGQPPTDHSFWWSHYEVYEPANGGAAPSQDGWHYFGGPQLKSSFQQNSSFGLVAWFALQPARMPKGPTGRYLSSPVARIAGRVVGYAPDPPMFFGDGHVSCSLRSKQTLFQFDFHEPYMKAVDSKGSATLLMSEVNSAGLRFADLPGVANMPYISFEEAQFRRDRELWARLEIWFDISLRWPGALLVCAPEVVLRTVQWPLVAA